MASFLRSAAQRLRPLRAAVGLSTAVLSATAFSLAGSSADLRNTGFCEEATGTVEESSDGQFAIFFDTMTQKKIRSAYPAKYPVLRCHKALVDEATAEKLRLFSGCNIKLAMECYVDDSKRQVLQLRVKETEEFGDIDLKHDKLYIVLSSKEVEEEDCDAGSCSETARRAVVNAQNQLGHVAQSTTKWVRGVCLV